MAGCNDIGRALDGWPTRLAMVIALCASLSLPAAAALADEQRDELEVKAAFLYHFARYVQWPDEAFFSLDSPIVIGVLGDPEFFEVASESLLAKNISNRQVEVRSFESLDEAIRAHVLFLGRAFEGKEAAIRSRLKSSHVFSISDSEGAAEKGIMANFYMDGAKVRFAVNPRAAREQGLVVSSKLLRVATIVD